jgi:hypothetical protein
LNPMRAHGAWVFLFASVAAGALLSDSYGVERAMLAGTGCAGAFLVASALSFHMWKKGRQMLVGICLAVLTPLGALWLDPDPRFIWVATIALPLTAATVIASRYRGLLSTGAILTGVASLVMAAPVTAIAGGASDGKALAVFALLWPFYSWRTMRIAAPLATQPWNRQALKSQGLKEAAVAAGWALAVTCALHLF